MKKLTTRTIVVLFLVGMSFSSYIFLNTVTPNVTTPAAHVKSEVEQNELKALENVEMVLPDLMLLKSVFEVGKRIIPAS